MFQRRRGAGDGHWRTRVSMQEVIERDRRVPECHTRGTGWSEETWGWQDPTFHCRNHLPGPAHPLTPLCSVKTLLCENCARVAPRAKKEKKKKAHACTSSSTSTNPLVCVCRVCAHVFFTWWTEQLVPEGGQPLSTGTQTRMFACEKQSSL